MRTTVTLEEDVERMLLDEMHRSRRSFKETLNAAVRSGLSGKAAPAKGKKFIVKARPMKLHAGLDPAGFNMLADDLDVDSFVGKQPRLRRS
jgi:hypothetical protein